MTHQDAGHYGAKHPAGARPDPAIAAKLEAAAEDGAVGCARAHDVAVELAVPPREVGRTLDLLELRIGACQLGLFGYGPKRKIVRAAPSVEPGIEAALLDAARETRLSCASAWDVAAARGVSRLEICAACEALGIKIVACQLGAF